MKRLTQVSAKRLEKNLALALIALVVGAWAAPSFGAEAAAQAGFEYDYWKDTRGNKGSQGFIPIRVDARFDALGVGVLTGAARTTFEPGGGPSESLTAFLDTKIVTSYEILGSLPVDILLGLDLNLPTGKTDLSAAEAVLVEDPELVTITSLGEGFNANPTVLVAKEFGPYVAGLGVGYDWRGKYDFSGQLGLNDFDPGDIWTVSATLRRDFSQTAHVRLFGNASWFARDKVAGAAVHKEGSFYMAGVEGGRRFGRLAAMLKVRAIFRQKSEFLTTLGALAAESRNSHGDEFRADVSADYALAGGTVLKSSLQGLWITSNGYSSDSPFFVGARKKAALGVGASRRLAASLEGEISLKGFLMKEEAAAFPLPRAERTDRGISGVLKLTSRF